jgi:hypothetical protein
MSQNTPRKIPQDMPRPGEQHPQEWREDLNPEVMAGQNVGLAGPHPEKGARTGYDLKEVHLRLRQFADDDLKQIPVLPQGSRLEQGATYIDLSDLERGEFTATGDMEARPGHWYH